ncbi:MAG: solute carrier family 23 protein [Clostridia bacterium]|nr:solute carrier family 23 protein [Clostridia bacterium]MDD3971528.1 solute carrier family 23 protein [Clostridia bacterium]MDD4543523.1 solute carrier family 23 protein [Clostridia bacterium]
MGKTVNERFTLKTAVLSFQHMFAMFGATVLVPILAGMSISVALLSAGIGTIAFYFITKKKVPVFLGSSFAFLPALIASMAGAGDIGSATWNVAMGKTSVAIMMAGLVYVIFSLLLKKIGVERIRKLFPPIVVGPVIIVIGMILAPKMFYNNIIGQSIWNNIPAWKEWTAAGITALTILVVSAVAKPKSFFKVIPILMGFVVGYIYSLIIGLVDYSTVDWSQIIIFQDLGKTFSFYKNLSFDLGVILSVVPIAIVTFMEHLGDISANSTVCNKDFMVDPGINRTVMGDGVATFIAGALGGPPNTTYGENTAVLAITKNYNPRNIFYAAVMAVIFGSITIFGTAVSTIPSAVIGGASIVLFGMISAAGLRALVDGKVDFSDTKNILVVSVILSVGLGLGAMSLAGDVTGDTAYKLMIGAVEISPLAVATLIGIILNLVIPADKKDEAESK